MYTGTSNQKYNSWRRKIFWLVWVNYAAFYLVRVNISVAIPRMIEEYGISKTLMGSVLTVFFIAYAVGHFINGQLGDKLGGRKLIAIGLIISAIINIIFGFMAGNIALMILLWGLNGYFQSMGWAPSVKTIANWFTLKDRPRKAGLLGTSYQLGHAISLTLAGFLVSVLNWRWIFWIPGIVCIALAFNWLIKGRDAPEEIGLPTVEEDYDGKRESKINSDNHVGFRFTLKKVLLNKGIWIIAISMFFLDFIRTGFMFWAITFLFEVQKTTVSIATYNIIIIPVSGSVGTLLLSWLANKYLKERSVRIIPAMLFLLVIVCWFFLKVSENNWVLSIILLVLIGFLLYGPHVLMTTFFPMEYASRKAAASAAGFISGWAYVGSAISSFLSGLFADNFGWNVVFYLWLAGGLMASILMTSLWNYKPVRGKYH